MNREIVASNMQLLAAPFIPKDKQVEAVYSTLKQKDTLCLLPTGYGKTLIFQVLPALCKRLSEKLPSYHAPNKPLVIVVSPLIALMNSQIQSINGEHKIDGTLASKVEDFKWKNRGDVNIVIGSPESWLSRSCLDKISKYIAKDVIAIVVIEAHALKW